MSIIEYFINSVTIFTKSICDTENQKTEVRIYTKWFFTMNHLETRDICSFINKIYLNKRVAPNNKWIFFTPLKFYYTSTIRTKCASFE